MFSLIFIICTDNTTKIYIRNHVASSCPRLPFRKVPAAWPCISATIPPGLHPFPCPCQKDASCCTGSVPDDNREVRNQARCTALGTCRRRYPASSQGARRTGNSRGWYDCRSLLRRCVGRTTWPVHPVSDGRPSTHTGCQHSGARHSHSRC